jgi:hypothetical protein
LFHARFRDESKNRDAMRHAGSLWASWSVGTSAVTLVEALNTTTGVDKLLLTSEEWVALVAKFQADSSATGAASGELIAT